MSHSGASVEKSDPQVKHFTRESRRGWCIGSSTRVKNTVFQKFAFSHSEVSLNIEGRRSFLVLNHPAVLEAAKVTRILIPIELKLI